MLLLLQDFAKAGADMFTFHLEAMADPQQLSQQEAHPAVMEMCEAVRAAGMKAGIALKPATPAELVLPYLQKGLLDMVRPAAHVRLHELLQHDAWRCSRCFCSVVCAVE